MPTKILIALYIKKKVKAFCMKKKIKNAKITKRSYAYKGYASTYCVKTLICFNPELQIKDTEYANRKKLIDLLTELKGFKFVTALVLEFKKKKMMIKENIAFFIQTQREKQLLVKMILMMHLNQSIVLLYQT